MSDDDQAPRQQPPPPGGTPPPPPTATPPPLPPPPPPASAPGTPEAWGVQPAAGAPLPPPAFGGPGVAPPTPGSYLEPPSSSKGVGILLAVSGAIVALAGIGVAVFLLTRPTTVGLPDRLGTYTLSTSSDMESLVADMEAGFNESNAEPVPVEMGIYQSVGGRPLMIACIWETNDAFFVAQSGSFVQGFESEGGEVSPMTIVTQGEHTFECGDTTIEGAIEGQLCLFIEGETGGFIASLDRSVDAPAMVAELLDAED